MIQLIHRNCRTPDNLVVLSTSPASARRSTHQARNAEPGPFQRFVMLILACCCMAVAFPTDLRAQSSSPQFDGFLKSLHDVQLASPEFGVVKEVLVEVGDHVDEGQLIAVLDDDLQHAAVELARLSASMQGALQSARADFGLHEHRTKQLRKLNEQGFARADELQRAETDLQVAAGRKLSAEEDQAIRKQELARAEIQLSRRRLVAPCAGVVAEVYRHPGEYISPTEPTVVRLVSPQQLVAVVNVPAAIAYRLTSSMSVSIRTSVPQKTVQGSILTIAPVIDGESGTIQVRALLIGDVQGLRPGDRCMMIVSDTALRQTAQQPTRKGTSR